MPKKHTISALVENHFGVPCRVSGLFSSRGFNIDSLSVGETEDPQISRMTIVVRGDDSVLEQVVKQLNRLIDVIRVIDITQGQFIERELALKFGIPMYAADPRFFAFGTKSGCRRIFAEEGVKHPLGYEDLFSVEEIGRAHV